MEETPNGIFCRFFNKDLLLGLRTTSCSELVNPKDLVAVRHRAQVYIDEYYEKIVKGEPLNE